MAVLIPVKAFAQSKTRLAPALDPAARAALARTMATSVVAAAAPFAVAVVCDDAEVAEWARDQGALVVWEPERGLNQAVEAGVARLGAGGVQRCIVAHADLPFVTTFEPMMPRSRVAYAEVTMVGDRAGNGTNALCIPTGAGFGFSYGPGSFQRHKAEAQRLGLAVRILEATDIAHDVDLPADLARPA